MEKIHMIGCDAVHPADFIYDVKEDHGYYLLILTRTPIRIYEDEAEKVYPAHHAALFAPESRIRYGACQEKYVNDWMIFSSDEKYVTDFPLIAKPFPVIDVDYCHNLFQLLTWEHSQENYESVISRLMEVLFHKLNINTGHRDLEGEYTRHLCALRKSIRNEPQKDWNVADMAATVNALLYSYGNAARVLP